MGQGLPKPHLGFRNCGRNWMKPSQLPVMAQNSLSRDTGTQMLTCERHSGRSSTGLGRADGLSCSRICGSASGPNWKSHSPPTSFASGWATVRRQLASTTCRQPKTTSKSDAFTLRSWPQLRKAIALCPDLPDDATQSLIAQGDAAADRGSNPKEPGPGNRSTERAGIFRVFRSGFGGDSMGSRGPLPQAQSTANKYGYNTTGRTLKCDSAEPQPDMPKWLTGQAQAS